MQSFFKEKLLNKDPAGGDGWVAYIYVCIENHSKIDAPTQRIFLRWELF